jgi:hypothetical protein
MAGTRAKALYEDRQPMGTGGHCCRTAVCRQDPKLLMVQTFIYSAIMYGGSVGREGRSKTRCQRS